jgi:hypothetical protein
VKPAYSASTSYGSSNFKKTDGKVCDRQTGVTSAGEKKTFHWQSSAGNTVIKMEPGLAKYGNTAYNYSPSEPPGNNDAETASGTLQLSGLFFCCMQCEILFSDKNYRFCDSLKCYCDVT